MGRLASVCFFANDNLATLTDNPRLSLAERE